MVQSFIYRTLNCLVFRCFQFWGVKTFKWLLYFASILSPVIEKFSPGRMDACENNQNTVGIQNMGCLALGWGMIVQYLNGGPIAEWSGKQMVV